MTLIYYYVILLQVSNKQADDMINKELIDYSLMSRDESDYLENMDYELENMDKRTKELFDKFMTKFAGIGKTNEFYEESDDRMVLHISDSLIMEGEINSSFDIVIEHEVKGGTEEYILVYFEQPNYFDNVILWQVVNKNQVINITYGC